MFERAVYLVAGIILAVAFQSRAIVETTIGNEKVYIWTPAEMQKVDDAIGKLIAERDKYKRLASSSGCI